MVKSIIASTKKRGRPATTGKGAQVNMRWHEDALTAVDQWRRKQPDLPSRTDAIRQLVEAGLKAKPGR